MHGAKKLITLAFAAILASALTISLTPAYAQKHGGGGSGHSSGDIEHADSGHDGGKGGKGGQGMGRGGGSGAQSLRDIFRDIESGAKTDQSSVSTDAQGKKGGSATTSSGKKGASTAGKKTGKTQPKAAEEEDSDRPAWAGIPGRESKPGRGNTETGTKKGDIYGDMYVLLRDENGVPILKQLADGTWVVQPLDANGVPLPIDAEGNFDATLAIAVDLGRLNVGRSPLTVLSSQYEELLKNINAADSVSVDASGRLVLTTNGVAAAVDSPLANLALYVEVLNTGMITGVTDPTKFATNISYLVDPSKTTADMLSAASFLAASADKTGTLTIDKVVDMNTILGITGTLSSQDPTSTLKYVDYTTFTYDRAAVYASTTVTVLVKTGENTYEIQTLPVMTAVFGGTNYTSTDGGVDGFAQAADDARAIIEYVHDNAIPATD